MSTTRKTRAELRASAYKRLKTAETRFLRKEITPEAMRKAIADYEATKPNSKR
jgi:hypothetical protein